MKIVFMGVAMVPRAGTAAPVYFNASSIPFPNPHQRNWSVAQKPAIDEILVLAHNHGNLLSREFPDRAVIGGLQANFEDVAPLMTSAGNPARQCGRALRVDE